MKQATKQFLQPNWKKIVITILLALPSLGIVAIACIYSNLGYDFCATIDFLLSPYYLITLPIGLLNYLFLLLENSLLSVFLYILIIIITLIYWYLILSFIIWIYEVTKNKPSIKKIIRIIGGLLIILLVIRNTLFFLPRVGYLVMEPATLSSHPSSAPFYLLGSAILLTSPLVFISGVLLLLQRVKWAWRLFLIALIIGLFFLLFYHHHFLNFSI